MYLGNVCPYPGKVDEMTEDQVRVMVQIDQKFKNCPNDLHFPKSRALLSSRNSSKGHKKKKSEFKLL